MPLVARARGPRITTPLARRSLTQPLHSRSCSGNNQSYPLPPSHSPSPVAAPRSARLRGAARLARGAVVSGRGGGVVIWRGTGLGSAVSKRRPSAISGSGMDWPSAACFTPTRPPVLQSRHASPSPVTPHQANLALRAPTHIHRPTLPKPPLASPARPAASTTPMRGTRCPDRSASAPTRRRVALA